MIRKHLTWNVIRYLITFAIILQLIVIWIQIQFISKDEEKDISMDKKDESRKWHYFDKLQHSIYDHSHLDISGQYKCILNVFLTEEITYQKSVTLISHCSEDQLAQLPNLVKYWKGLISISVFITRKGIEDIFHFYRCFPAIRKRVLFNIVYHVSMNILEPSTKNLSCTTGIKYSNNKSFELGIEYPINLMRNVAKKGASSLYHFVIDIDMIPNPNLHAELNNYLQGEMNNSLNKKVIYITPAYEMDSLIQLPANKTELLQLRKQNLVRPFYQQLCNKCQKQTDYKAWEKETNLNMSLHPLYEVTWAASYEPFYISQSNVPLYDERFMQYGFNRISQVCELHVLGYSFLVLNSAFLLHRGLKTYHSHHKNKEKELMKNLILYESYKNDLLTKHPDSLKRC